jgi:lipoyl(octanoyl) transferase
VAEDTGELWVATFGQVSYREAVLLQEHVRAARQQGLVPDALLLLEHPPVITLGAKVRNDRSHVLASPDALAAAGVELFEAGRGGDVTYHGPGQLVGYPILDLRPDRCDVHRYVRDLEQVLIDVAGEYGITAARSAGLTGVWVGDEKLAAIGIRISRWITSHGFALNVTTDLTHFNYIVPCGITDRGVTSLGRLLGRTVPLGTVEDAVIRAFAAIFDREPLPAPSTLHAGAQP